MESVLSFLADLQQHNCREWFAENKDRYRQVQAVFNRFTEKLLMGLSELDEDIRGLSVADCTYRIYRDIRFTADKSPYKTHMGAYVCPKGKKSGFAGYYFHLEPKAAGYLNGSLLACGMYQPDRDVLQSIREEIVCNGEAFDQAVRQAEGFLWDDDRLKRLPKGFETETEYGIYLRQKSYSLAEPIPDGLTKADDLLEFALSEFRKTVAFNKILNRAAVFAMEQKKEGEAPSW